jgi:phosphate transport system substrate-binding protein
MQAFRRTKPARFTFTLILMLVVAVAFPKARRVAGQTASTATTLKDVNSIYVEPFGSGGEGEQLRSDLIKYLGKIGKFTIVDRASDANATLKANGQIWIKGYVTTSTKSPSLNRQPVYGGFLSAELLARDGEPMWSYLVTPSKFSWFDIRDDLARSLVKQLVIAREQNSQPNHPRVNRSDLQEAHLTVAGATFPAPLYQKWFESLNGIYPQLRFEYQAVGSQEGLRLLSEGKADFAASDVPPNASTGNEPKLYRIASVLGAVVVTYNVKGLTQDLKFTPEMLADIYMGKLKKWNDLTLAKINRGLDLPDADITVVHRSDGSGTTYAWADFLSRTSLEWKNSLGTSMTLQWPVGIGVSGNEGVASSVQKTPNAIGYVELAYAIQHQLSFGAIRNSAGEFVRPDLRSLSEAAKSLPPTGSTDSLGSISNSAGKEAYPIATFTWLLIPEQLTDPAKKSAAKAFLQWMLTSGQKECSSLGYAPLPSQVAAQQLDLLKRID